MKSAIKRILKEISSPHGLLLDAKMKDIPLLNLLILKNAIINMKEKIHVRNVESTSGFIGNWE